MLHLIYRLVVQPNTARAHAFAEVFIASGGIESLLVLLQKEAKAGDCTVPISMTKSDESSSVQGTELDSDSENLDRSQDDVVGVPKDSDSQEKDFESQPLNSDDTPVAISISEKIGRTSSVTESPSTKNLGGISLSISADNARNNVYNVEKSDGIIVGIIELLGALVSSGHLKVGSSAPTDLNNFASIGLQDRGGTMFDDKVSLLLFALQKAFQAAPNRLMTGNVYTALLGASVGPNLLCSASFIYCQLCKPFFMLFYLSRAYGVP